MVVGVSKITLNIPGVYSLKEKRQVLKSLMARVRNSFNASVAEIGKNDVWQSAVIGISVIGNDKAFVNSCLDKIVDMVEGLGTADIVDHEIEMTNY